MLYASRKSPTCSIAFESSVDRLNVYDPVNGVPTATSANGLLSTYVSVPLNETVTSWAAAGEPADRIARTHGSHNQVDFMNSPESVD